MGSPQPRHCRLRHASRARRRSKDGRVAVRERARHQASWRPPAPASARPGTRLLRGELPRRGARGLPEARRRAECRDPDDRVRGQGRERKRRKRGRGHDGWPAVHRAPGWDGRRCRPRGPHLSLCGSGASDGREAHRALSRREGTSRGDSGRRAGETSGRGASAAGDRARATCDRGRPPRLHFGG
jgi:hypothetical protein